MMSYKKCRNCKEVQREHIRNRGGYVLQCLVTGEQISIIECPYDEPEIEYVFYMDGVLL